MTISAKIVTDSISPEGKRITTMELMYPRFIHSEFMTHRVFSRNASSSRAIPVARMIQMLRDDPAMPIYWGSNKPGMQAGDEVDSIHNVTSDWLEAMENAIYKAQKLMASGLHKQIANRILEPWAHIKVVVTATEWDNFFQLRAHPDAQPEIRVLAEQMLLALAESRPNKLGYGEWHLPYITAQDWDDVTKYIHDLKGEDWLVTFSEKQLCLLEVSVARCARVSYLLHDGQRSDIYKDRALFDKLIRSKPAHASPCEHQALPDPKGIVDTDNSYLWGNFVGWLQHRKVIGV